MADGVQGSTLRFKCEECGTHLGVDESLAGLEAPCPKCGAKVTAPELETRKSRLPTSGVVRGVSGNGGFQANTRERGASIPSGGGGGGAGGPNSSDGLRRSRTVVPNEGSTPNEVKIMINIVVAIALAAFVVALVTWYLKNL